MISTRVKSPIVSRFLNLWRDQILLDGGRSQLSEFMAPHIEKLYKQAWMYTHDSEMAEDLLQDLTVKVYDNLANLASIQYPLSWLRRCLYNLFVDRYRREKFVSYVDNISEISDAQVSEKGQENEANPDQSHTHGYMLERIRESILGLSPAQRAVATLFFYENMSLQEISDQLGIALGTVKSRLHRARGHLTVELGDLMPSASDDDAGKMA